MNKIVKTSKDGRNTYTLTTENGQSMECSVWFEKKTNQWHVKLPKDNPSGRTYVRLSNFDKSDIYEFETKTEFRTGLTSGGWKSKMTEEEKVEMDKLEKRIDEIKNLCQSRKVPKVDPNSIEGIELMIKKLQEKLSKKKVLEVKETIEKTPKKGS